MYKVKIDLPCAKFQVFCFCFNTWKNDLGQSVMVQLTTIFWLHLLLLQTAGYFKVQNDIRHHLLVGPFGVCFCRVPIYLGLSVSCVLGISFLRIFWALVLSAISP